MLEILIPVLFIALVGTLLAILKQVPEKSAMLTGLGILMTFVIGLTFTMLIPSFNENWSQNTAKNPQPLPRHLLDHRACGGGSGEPHPGRSSTGDVSEPAVPASLSGIRAQQERGRRVWQREGCMYCHSQQIRPLVERDQAVLDWDVGCPDCGRTRVYLGPAALFRNPAHRPGFVPRRREVQRRLALLALLLPAPDGARLYYARVHLAI